MQQGQAVDLGKIETGQNFGKQLAGIGELVGDYGKHKKGVEAKKAFQEAWENKDEAALNKIAIENPEFATQIKERSDMTRFLREDNQTSLWKGAQEAIGSAVGADGKLDRGKLTDYLTTRIDKGATIPDGDMQNSIELREMAFDPDVTEDELLNNLKKTVSLAERFVPSLAEGAGSKKGKFSAKTMFYKDNTSVMSDPDTGETIVRNPIGDIVEGEARLATLKKARESGIQYEYDKNFASTMGDQTAKGMTEPENQRRIQAALSAQATADKNVPLIQGLNKNIRNYDRALTAIDGLNGTEGANTGWLDSHFPSFKTASIELDQIRGELGLDIVGATTFGALSESELAFALDVALPDSMQPDKLRAWVAEKKRVQEILLSELNQAQGLLLQGKAPAEVYQEMNALPQGRTEQQIRENMRKYDMSRKEVIGVMWENHELTKK